MYFVLCERYCGCGGCGVCVCWLLLWLFFVVDDFWYVVFC